MHASPQPARDPAVDSVASVIPASAVTPPYTELQSHMDTVSLYEPVSINDFAPANRFQRQTYISNLRLSVDVYMYRMAYGGSVGTLTFIWKIDPTISDHEGKNACALVSVTESLPKYATRDVKKTFIERYTDVADCPKMVRRHIFRELTEDCLAP